MKNDILTQDRLEHSYYIYSEPINPIKSMRSKVPKMKLQRDKYILKSATLPTEV